MVWGPDRIVLELVAAALAHAIGPTIYWFEIDDLKSPGKTPSGVEKSPSRGVRFFRIRPKEVALTDSSAILSHWALFPITEGASFDRDEVRDFLSIPDAVQSVLTDASPEVGPTSIVVSNVDRASELFTPTAGTFAPYIQLLNRRGVTLIFTNGGTPRENVWDFDVVLHVEVGQGGVIGCTCEKGQPDSGFAPFQKEVRTTLDALMLALS